MFRLTDKWSPLSDLVDVRLLQLELVLVDAADHFEDGVISVGLWEPLLLWTRFGVAGGIFLIFFWCLNWRFKMLGWCIVAVGMRMRSGVWWMAWLGGIRVRHIIRILTLPRAIAGVVWLCSIQPCCRVWLLQVWCQIWTTCPLYCNFLHFNVQTYLL